MSQEIKTIKLADEKFCTECGQVIKLKAEICPKCGVRQIISTTLDLGSLGTTSPSGRNRLIAILLAFFVGGFGGHKFYVGQIGRGVLYLIFCWTFIPSYLQSSHLLSASFYSP